MKLKRLVTGLMFGGPAYAIAWSAGAGGLWSAVTAVAVAAVAAALT